MDEEDRYMSMSEWTGCSKFGHQWRPVDEPDGWEECVHCGQEREAANLIEDEGK